MKRKPIFAIAAGVAAGALTGTILAVHAGPAVAHGFEAGTSTYTNNVTACTSVGTTSTGLCTIKMKGDYFDPATLLGNGTYSGTVTVNYSTYAFNANANENCAEAHGTITYHSQGSTMKTTLNKSASFLCDEPGTTPLLRDVYFTASVASANGIWVNVNKSVSYISWNTLSSPTSSLAYGSAAEWLDQGEDVGNINIVS